MRSAEEANALQLELLANQGIEINTGDDHVASQDAGRFVHEGKRGTETVENFLREEGDLAFVIVLVVKEAITANSTAGDTFDALGFLQRVIVWRPAVMAEVVVAGRDEEVANDHSKF
jgi:hypothetical protein